MTLKPYKFKSPLKDFQFVIVEIPGIGPAQAFQYFGNDWRYAFRAGDYLVFRMIDTIKAIDYGGVYVIGLSDTVIIKRVYRFKTDLKFLAGSDNDDKDSEGRYIYSVLEVPVGIVVEVGKVIAVIRRMSV